ncbi:nucleotidyltransferase domain-containing protein [Bacillus sp. B4EP4a]|nr:nucleotidyltransferase domain-containing protein [Bacillus sp. B4EP4a]
MPGKAVPGYPPRKQGGKKRYISQTRQFFGRDSILDSRIYITLMVLQKKEMVLCAGFVSKHIERDAFLPKQRDILLVNALKDLSADPGVLAIYIAGSLAKGNHDNYSDIDLHTIVIPKRKAEFLKGKRDRANNWGDVSFHEDYNPSSPYVVTHYDTFVKVDSWYHAPEEIVPSIWLKEVSSL